MWFLESRIQLHLSTFRIRSALIIYRNGFPEVLGNVALCPTNGFGIKLRVTEDNKTKTSRLDGVFAQGDSIIKKSQGERKKEICKKEERPSSSISEVGVIGWGSVYSHSTLWTTPKYNTFCPKSSYKKWKPNLEVFLDILKIQEIM
ncbi:hypothetical protein AVEN_106530-1 [Araneus ventricosus]|uniref:Uncharacterized protein n=1 Tax=Araneus ventricosus TaxID=182803 RepID=A0A4Y2G4N3_ARAVE|nr:hypothetical protein AVEN_106530-1 [Araneus ventricosus]